MEKINVAILGASGAVGREMLKILEEYDIPVAKLLPLASARSAGGYVRTFLSKKRLTRASQAWTMSSAR